MGMHIGIAGAGLLGRLLALQLSRGGHRVEVFDPAAGAAPPLQSCAFLTETTELIASSPSAAYAAGWTAAGMLSPVAELECANVQVFAWGLRSLELWPQIIAKLSQPVSFCALGSLLLAHRTDEGAARRVVDLLTHKAPQEHAPQRLTPEQLRTLEPAVHGPAHAWLLPHEAHIHTVQAMAAMADAASLSGTRWHWGQSVHTVSARTLSSVQGVHHFDWVFDVRGTGANSTPRIRGEAVESTPRIRGEAAESTPRISGEAAESTPRIRGVRGEIFWLHAPGVTLQRPLRLLHPRHRVYLVPRPGNVVVVGASEIESEDRSPVSLRSTVELLAAAHSIVPELAEARVIHSEANLRPALPDNLPLLQTQNGITCINGLFRHGWLLAPALVERAVAELANAQHASSNESIELATQL